MNNPLILVDPYGELWVSTGNSSAPYSWVDACQSGATCYESAAARVGADLVVYGSASASDVTTLSANKHGLVDLTGLAGHPDSAFTLKVTGTPSESFLTVDAAAAFWNTAVEYQSAYPGSDKLMVTDMGVADGSHFGLHKTHNLGRSIDLRYQDSSGANIWNPRASSLANTNRTRSLIGIALSQGFDQNYTGNISVLGGNGNAKTEYAHRNHLHIGYSIGKALNLKRRSP